AEPRPVGRSVRPMLLCSDLPVNGCVLLEQGGSMLRWCLMARISGTVRLTRRRQLLLPQSRAQRARAARDQLPGPFPIARRACRARVAQRNQCGGCEIALVAQGTARRLCLLCKPQPTEFQTSAVGDDLGCTRQSCPSCAVGSLILTVTCIRRHTPSPPLHSAQAVSERPIHSTWSRSIAQ